MAVSGQSIEITSPRQAELQMLAGFAGQPVEDMHELRRLEASIYLVDLEVHQEAEAQWRVVRAEWRHAVARDFF